MIKDKKNQRLFIWAVVGGLLIFLHILGALRPLEDSLSALVSPLAARWQARGLSSALPGSEEENIDDLRGRVDELNKELAVQLVAESQYREMVEENRKLRNLLNFSDDQDYQTIGAALIAREEAAKGGYDIIINRGTVDGLRAGLGVINEEGTIIGLVKEARKNTAEVCLITTPDCRLAAAIQNEDKTQGIADGDLGLTVKMEYIPQTEKINLGDIVISSGLGGDIPRGLVIGRIARIRSESNDVWQEATIEPLVNFNDLTVVAVVIP